MKMSRRNSNAVVSNPIAAAHGFSKEKTSNFDCFKKIRRDEAHPQSRRGTQDCGPPSRRGTLVEHGMVPTSYRRGTLEGNVLSIPF